MYKKFLIVTILAAFSTHAWASPENLGKRKDVLTSNTMEAVNQCRCLVNAVDRQEKLFPMTAKSGDKSMIKTQANYLDLISDMKINAGRAQTSIIKIIRDWDSNKNTDQDLKALDLKVSSELRAFSSFCVQPFDSLANEIYKRSSILNRKKIDSAQCGIVRNKK